MLWHSQQTSKNTEFYKEELKTIQAFTYFFHPALGIFTQCSKKTSKHITVSSQIHGEMILSGIKAQNYRNISQILQFFFVFLICCCYSIDSIALCICAEIHELFTNPLVVAVSILLTKMVHYCIFSCFELITNHFLCLIDVKITKMDVMSSF